MSLNLKKLVIAATVVASTVGFFTESAEARRARFETIDGDIKLDNQQVQASFDIVTDKSLDDAVENFSLTNSITGNTFFTSAIDSIGQRTLLNTASDLNGFLTNSGLESFGIDTDDVFAQIPNGEEPLAVYVLNLSNDLTPNDEATLTLFFDESKASFPQPNGLLNLTNSLEGVTSYIGTETVPGVLIRNSRDGLDDVENVINGRTIDQFGVGLDAPLSKPFSVTVPEPATGSSLLIAGAFGGLFILKRNQSVKKRIEKIEN